MATLLGQRLKNLQGRVQPDSPFDFERVHDLFAFVKEKGLQREILYEMLPVAYAHPKMDPDSVLTSIGFRHRDREEILAPIPLLGEKFARIRTSQDEEAGTRWIMKELRKAAVGNLPLPELAKAVRKGGRHG